MITLPASQRVRAVATLVVVSLIGLVLMLIPPALPVTTNPLLETLFLLMTFVSPIVILASFIYGLIVFAYEENTGAKWWIMVGIVVLAIIGYAAGYFSFIAPVTPQPMELPTKPATVPGATPSPGD